MQGVDFEAHKVVLVARSPVFDAMFQANLTEMQSNTLIIEDIEPIVFAEVLRFLYTDEVINLEDRTSDLLAAADKYMLDLLKLKCEAHLDKKITVENCSKLLLLADLHSAERLKKTVLDFVRFRSCEIAKIASWKLLLKTANPQLIRDISAALMTRSNSVLERM